MWTTRGRVTWLVYLDEEKNITSTYIYISERYFSQQDIYALTGLEYLSAPLLNWPDQVHHSLERRECKLILPKYVNFVCKTCWPSRNNWLCFVCEVGYPSIILTYTTQGYYNFSYGRVRSKLTRKAFLAQWNAEINLPTSHVQIWPHTAHSNVVGGIATTTRTDRNPFRWTRHQFEDPVPLKLKQ